MNYPLLADRVKHFKESEEGVNTMCKIVEDLMNKSRDIGISEGISNVNALNNILIHAGRFDDLKRASENPAYQEQLMRELVPSN